MPSILVRPGQQRGARISSARHVRVGTSHHQQSVHAACGRTFVTSGARTRSSRRERRPSALPARAASSTTPSSLLVDSYERFGPIFTLKIFHHNAVFMLGPEANHYMLVSHAKNFLWRAGHMRDLIPLLGDGLLTIDGPDPPHAPQADAARVSPRADRGRDRRDAGRGRPRARGDATRRDRGHLRLDPRACAARCDAGAVRARPRPGEGGRPERGRGVRGGAVVLRARLPAPDAARAADSVRADDALPAPARRAPVRGDRPPPRLGRAWGGHPLDAARRIR